MNLSPRNILIGSIAITIVVVSALVYLYRHDDDSAKVVAADAPRERLAQVKTMRLKKAVIQEALIAYGVVLPLPDKLQTISVAYPSQIETIQVNPGQFVQTDEVLLSLHPGPTALLQWHKAQTELQAALRNQELLQQRIRLKLATRQDLISARLRVAQAKVMIENLSDQGIDKYLQITAKQSGIIYQVNVQQGQQLPAGAPLLQIVAQNQWVVRLGIEPEDYKHIEINQQVLMTPVNSTTSEPVQGRIEIITQQIDPDTRLLNVFVRPESYQTLLINDFVKARIVISSVNAWVVPRQAVLPKGDGYDLFTIVDGRAVKHRVQVGLENNTQVEVIDGDLHDQDEVVILGNYELQAGMAVAEIPETEK